MLSSRDIEEFSFLFALGENSRQVNNFDFLSKVFEDINIKIFHFSKT